MPWPSLDSLIAPLASAASYLPSLPSVPIPAKLQQRLVAFLLRRAIGRFVKGGGHSLGDEGRIEADVRNGRVVVRNVELDDAAINALLSPTSDTDTDLSSTTSPIRFEKGTVTSITTLLAWPLSRFDIVADEIELVFRVVDPTGSCPPDHTSHSSSNRQAHSDPRQSGGDSDCWKEDPLAESHVSLAIAHDFVSHELRPSEDAELRASLHLSPSHSVDLPGAFGGTPRVANGPPAGEDTHIEDAEATMLAGVIEKLLGRLGVTAQNLRIRLVWSSSAALDGETRPTAHELELRVERLEFRGGGVADESGTDATRPLSHTKRITILPTKLYLHTRTSKRPTGPFQASQPLPRRRRTSAVSSDSSCASSTSSSSEDEHDLLAMSQSVADLRASVQTSVTSSRADLFASARSHVFESVIEQPEEEEHERPDSPFVDPDASTRPRTSPVAANHARGELLASFGVAEPVVVEMSSRAARRVPGTECGAGLLVDGRLGDVVAVGIRPEHFRVFFNLVNQVTAPNGRPSPRATGPAANRRSRAGAELAVALPAFRVVLASRYETPIPETFWNRTSAPLAIPHLRLSLEQISLSGRPQHGDGVELSAKAFAVTEVGVLEDGSLRVLPILVNDPGLSAPVLHAWPEIEVLSTDWVTRPQQQYGKDWRILARVFAEERKATKSRPSPGSAEEMPQPDIRPAIRYRQAPHDASRLDLQSLHVFLDFAICTRLDDLIHAVKSSDEGSSRAGENTTAPTPRPVSRDPAAIGQEAAPSVAVTCPLLRIEVRCPAPGSLRDAAQDEDLVRGGRLVLDLCDLDVTATEGAQTVQMRDVRTYLASAQATRARVFLAASTMQGDEEDQATYRPTFKFSSSAGQGSSQPPRCDLDLPLLRASFDKGTFDSLQLLADDVNQFIAKEFSITNSGPDAQWSGGNKMIGSRFFGTKSYMHPKRRGRGTSWRGHESETDSVDSTATMTADDTRSAEPLLGQPADTGTEVRTTLLCQTTVTDVILDIALAPVNDAVDDSSAHRLLRVKFDDLSLNAETLVNGDDNLRLKLAVMDCVVQQSLLDLGEPLELLRRTLARSPTERANAVLKVDFSSSTEQETSLKESRVQLGISNVTASAGPDIAWIHELLAFVKAPEGAFEEVVPNELLKLRVRMHEFSLNLAAPTLPSAIALVVGDARIRSDLMPDLPRSIFHVDLDRTRLLAIAGKDDLLSTATSYPPGPGDVGSSWRYWRSLGYVPMADLATVTADVRVGNGLVLPDLEVLLDRVEASVTICADTVAALAAFAEDLQHWAPTNPKHAEVPKRHISPLRRTSGDLLASVDEAAFERARHLEDSPIPLDDDVPVNEDYLADALRQAGPSRARPPARLRQRASREDVSIISDVDGETIKMLAPDGLQIVDGWLEEPRVEETLHSAYGARLRARVKNANVTIRLYEGFDWADTRRAIQERAKVVRRRLQKIRQLLASGQTPDSTAEDASVIMFGSVHLGLPAGASEMPPKDLLAAIEQELEDAPDTDGQSTTAASGEAGSQGSTQRGPRATSAKTKAGKRRRSLTRPVSPAIEVNLRGINTSFESYDPETPLSRVRIGRDQPLPLLSRLSLDVTHLEILDNLPSSTWHKFLTELRPSDGGIVRPTETPMARAVLNIVRGETEASATQGEVLLKAKIVPLRLYIDQDALDFLKAFSAFQAPQKSASAAERPPHPIETFYQRVEIMSVRLKVDYKPKRVDYNALRSGKTAELMNFFHFEGSEMTLRHLVVTGVSGTSTLSSLVQDIWTPDVKANQLADVVSGIAPLRSVVNVGSGVANLVLLPIEQYRKDGRLVRGLQRGAHAFAKQTTLEAIHTGAKLATGTQVILEQAEHVLGGSFARTVSAEAVAAPILDDPSTQTSSDEGFEEARFDARSRYASQPANLRQGVEGAYTSFGENLKDAAQTILAVPMEVYERSGEEGAVRAVVRAVPLAVLKPMIGASGAVSKALLGLRNTLDPQAQAGELEDKYKPTR
ncbi:hypothetical protein JCM3774_005049 [Rhodotorula dairenensis]